MPSVVLLDEHEAAAACDLSSVAATCLRINELDKK
jgi:hypothetical protein